MLVDVSRTPLSPTPRTVVNRHSERAATDRAALDDVLDSGLICHLGVLFDGAPVVLPTGYGRDGDTLYLHGSTGTRSMTAGPVCVTVTIVDGIVYARSVMHHSMNYRSAVVHGTTRRVDDPEEKLRGLQAVTEHLAPGSWDHARLPNKKELAATVVLALDLTEASVKIRAKGPVDEDFDIEANTAWAGVLPLSSQWGVPESDSPLPVPEHVLKR
ncbi:pyridoxamine 5'-phosphate oxidase family protein [Kutzneria sp. CA-103260]|uniref:pyridoxamine 5'-phosphate oxidase family protein n=1 Tax=Kutzneria sp. CA-103260 TaxID=2802641 RepID=UPI001BAB9600|nr:pyridoxamine 5'-phosphate oxidase family protein [Kutzneria sp. CA-103260]